MWLGLRAYGCACVQETRAHGSACPGVRAREGGCVQGYVPTGVRILRYVPMGVCVQGHVPTGVCVLRYVPTGVRVQGHVPTAAWAMLRTITGRAGFRVIGVLGKQLVEAPGWLAGGLGRSALWKS